MAKQTIKQRKAIRSAAAKKGWETRRKPSPVQDAAQERAMGFSDGVRITTDFYEGCIAMRRGAREMYATDIGYWAGEGDARHFVWVHKPTLWQRIKGWFS